VTVIRAVFRDGRFTTEDQKEIDKFKKTLVEGELVEISYRKWHDTRSQRASNYLHALLQRYAHSTGNALINVKNELCISFGISLQYGPGFEPPGWGGHFVEYYGTIYFRKTTKEYTIPEMCALIERIKVACYDNHIDIEDLEIEHKDWYGKKNDRA